MIKFYVKILCLLICCGLFSNCSSKDTLDNTKKEENTNPSPSSTDTHKEVKSVFTSNSDYGGSRLKAKKTFIYMCEDLFKRYISFDKSVIDIGCGFGAYSQVLKRIGYEHVYGIDLYKENFNYIERLRKAGYKHAYGIDLYQESFNYIDENKPGVHFIEGKFPDESVLKQLPTGNWGIVLARNVFHFMTKEEISKSLAIIYNNLSDPGFLLATFLTKNPDKKEHSKYIYVKANFFRKKLEEIGYKIYQFETKDDTFAAAIAYKETRNK